MKMLRVFALLVVAFALTLPAHAQGTNPLPRGNVSGFGVFTASASDGLDGGTGFGVSGAVFFARVWGVEGGYRRLGFDVIGTDDNTLEGGTLDANIITLNLIARLPRGSVQPFVSGGVAFVSGDYATDATLVQQLAQFNLTPTESFESTVGFNVGGGVDFQATRSIGFFVEGRFIAATADTVGGLTDDITQVTATTDGTQEMNLFTVAGGIRIFF